MHIVAIEHGGDASASVFVRGGAICDIKVGLQLISQKLKRCANEQTSADWPIDVLADLLQLLGDVPVLEGIARYYGDARLSALRFLGHQITKQSLYSLLEH